MVTFTLRQTSAIIDGPAYSVVNQVTAAVGADIFAYVFSTPSQKFSHYATAADVQTWPTSYEQALLLDMQFYRLDSITRVWSTVVEMNRDLHESQRRLQSLADELNHVEGSLTIDRSITIQGV